VARSVDYAHRAVIGAGTVINPIIKVVTTVIILAAVGIFIVKPVLDTTDKAIDSVNTGIRSAQQQSQQTNIDVNLGAARSRAESYTSSLQTGWPAAARQVRSCIDRAGDNVGAMERCADLGLKLVHTVQSDRTFALSYADSLAAQGRGAESERVRACVKQAGFAPAAMERCRNLADNLLFG
jgi:hypothetical protein